MSRVASKLVAKLVAIGLLICGARCMAEEPITAEQRDHWAFKPLARPELPIWRPEAAVANPVDTFIVARLQQKELRVAPPADRMTLARRVTFDLTGLPPRIDDVERFAADPAPDTYERVIDRLLASVGHGDHVGQRWLDLARFAETDGFEHDHVRPEAWRYRDWVIDALNRDLPYDRFLALQIAGDELQPGDAAAAIATGFCLAGPDMPDINSQDERRHNVLNDIASTVGSVALGLQMGCAQCHDHKYDPISQGDFYRLRAFFAPAVRVQKNKSLTMLGDRGAKSEAQYVMIRGDYRRAGKRVEPEFPRIANAWAARPRVRPHAERGDEKGAERGYEGLRAELTEWLTRADHPLATRVIANRLWQQHFGDGLCRTPSDFGAMGEEPEHGELLDYLATELPRREWSQKQLRKLLVTSATYRQAGRASDGNRKAGDIDPENRLWWRYPLRRIDAESLRDAMLGASGYLSSRRGGRGIMAPMPPELTNTLLANHWQVATDREDHHRRSIYLFARRNLRYPVLEAFDRPDGQASCAARNRSTTAPQSLLLLNSEFTLTTARRMAGVILAHAGADSRRQIIESHRRAFGRSADAREVESGKAFLARQRAILTGEGRKINQLALPIPSDDSVAPSAAAALVDYCVALFNANEFLYLD